VEAPKNGKLEEITPEQLEDEFVNSGVIEDICIIVAIDMTRSNAFKGRKTFGGKNLHEIEPSVDQENMRERLNSGSLNPYERAILASDFFLSCDTDGGFPLYYFGSVQAAELGGFVHVKDCENTADLWQTYRRTVGKQELSGPGRFTPLFERAVERAKALGRYHILLVFTDGDVEDQNEFGAALGKASAEVPLSVVVIGVGDGPFNQAEQFDDYMPPGKRFDNLQFVTFNKINAAVSLEAQQREFFAQAFNEIPRQYRMCKEILGYRAPMRRVGFFEEDITMEPRETDGADRKKDGRSKNVRGRTRLGGRGGGGGGGDYPGRK